MMRVTNRHRQSISLVRLHAGVQSCQQLDHVLDLQLVCVAMAGDRAFDLGRRVFGYRQRASERRGDGGTTRLPQFQRRADAAMHEHFFNRNFTRLVQRNNLRDTIKNNF